MNIENLTIGEIAAIEKYSGKKLGDFAQLQDDIDTRFMLALALVYAKRSGFPAATMDDIEQLTIDEITALLDKSVPNTFNRSEITESIVASLPPMDGDLAGESTGATPTTMQASPSPVSAPPIITR